MATRSLGTLTLDLIAKIGGYVAPLDQAARKTKKNTDDMKKDFNGLKVSVIALGAAAGVAFAALAKASINAADDLSKASQQVGFSVESFSALKFTAGLAGVELEGLSGSLLKFNKNIADASNKGTGPAADAFADLQIELRGTDGQLKSTEVLFSEVADKLAMLEDGALKTALAQDLLGRSGAKLIPLLNGGAKGLSDGADEAKRLGQVIGTDAAKAAEQFNDNLSRLKSSVTGVSNAVAMDLIDDLSELSDIFSDPGFQDGVKVIAGGLADIAKIAGSAIKEISNVKSQLFGFDEKSANQIKAQIEAVQSALDNPSKRVRFFDRNGFIPWVLGYESEDELKQKLIELNALLENAIKVDVPEAENKSNSVDLTVEQIEKNRKLREEKEKQIETAKKLAEQQAAHAKKIQEDYQSVIGSMEKQIALYGNTTRVAEVRYDLENGYLDGIDEKQKRYYLNLANQLDLLDEQRELIAMLDEFDWSLAPADAEGGKTSEWAKIAEDAAERINGSFSDAWMNIDKGFTGLRDGIVGGFKRMLAEMAHEAVTKPIVLQIQQSMTGGATTAGQGTGNMIGAVGAGGWYAAIALAVVAGANVWNKSQEEKFAKMTAEYRQGTQFVGGVLGEGNKKSESISNSIDHLAKLSDAALGINSAMLNELIMLNNNIGLFAAGIAKEFGASGLGDFSHIKTGKTTFGFNDRAITLGDEAANIYFGGLGDRLLGGDVNEFVQGIMGGITTKISENLYSKRVKINDSGIKIMGQTLSDMLESGVIDAYAFADVNTKKKALGVTYSNKTREQISGLDEDVRKQFAKVFENGADALRVASKTFGIDFDKYLDVLRIDTSKISLKGLEGDALTAELEAFFSSTLDTWVGGITTETQRIERQLKSGNGGFANFIERMVIGMEPQFRTVQTKAGELISQYQKIGEGAFETFMRLAGETEAFMRVADRLRLNFNLVGVAAIEVVQELSKAAGGFDDLSKAFGNYAGKFLSDADKFAYAEKVVNQAFAELGIAVPKTREAFTALVQGIDITTEQGREQFVAIMRLVDASDMYISALEEQTKAAEAARKAAIGDAFGSLNRAVQAERDLLDKMNQGAIDAIRKSLTEHQAVANSLSAALGAMAIESAQADLMTRRAAQAQLVAANAITKAGGPLPGSGQLDAALDVLARPSQQLFASFEEYARDFYSTQKNLRELQEAAVGQVSIDEQNLRAQEAYHAAELDRLDKLVGFYQDQINALNGIDESVIGVADAVNKLNLALLAGGINASVPASLLSSQALSSAQSVIPAPNRVPLVEAATIQPVSAGLSAADLVAEIKQLREELQASQFAIAKNTLDTRKILDRWDGDGLPQEREEGVSS